MAGATATTGRATCTYVYAVGWASKKTSRREGVGGGKVEAVGYRDLTAITSAVPAQGLRARRRDLLRHAEIVQEAFERSTVVPLRFGTTLADRDAVVEELLAPAYGQLVGLLRRFDGLAEVTVRAFYREEEVLREIVREHPRLARLRDTASPLELGEAVAKALAAKRDAAAAEIVDTVGRFALDVALDERRTELEIVRGAFLIDRDALASVDRELAELARAQAETTVFKYTGPLPPHHFVSFAAG